MSSSGLSTIDEAVAAIAAGRMVVVVDSPDRENEGDLVMAAEHVTPEAINFMATHGRGLICVALERQRLDTLGIPPMVSHSTDPKGTAFHVSVDSLERATTGISASDRSNTIRQLADPRSIGEDFTRPGHVFPLAYAEGGVLRRAGIRFLRVAGVCHLRCFAGVRLLRPVVGIRLRRLRRKAGDVAAGGAIVPR